ncbi:hypothetical protein ACQUFY_10660 [Robbsia andropogonis]
METEIARADKLPVREFEWYKVSRELNYARHDVPALIETQK